MTILAKLIGSHARVKIIKLFYLNPEAVFAPRDVAKRAHTSPEVARREIRMLADINFIKAARSKAAGYALNLSFPLFIELRELMLTVAPVSKRDLADKLKRVGKIKLVTLSGIFLKNSDSRVDMLIVGDGFRKAQLDWTLKIVESEVGKELSYAILETADFKYRLGMNDKFIRDVFDYPHETIIDKIGVVR